MKINYARCRFNTAIRVRLYRKELRHNWDIMLINIHFKYSLSIFFPSITDAHGEELHILMFAEYMFNGLRDV